MEISMTSRIANYISCVKRFEKACEKKRQLNGPLSEKPGRSSFEEQTLNYKEKLSTMPDDQFINLIKRADKIVEELYEKPYNEEYHSLIKEWIKKEEFDFIIETLKKNNNVIIDDHGNGNRTLNAIAISTFTNPHGKVFYVPHTKTPHCLNYLYVGWDDQVHVSRNSVGGVIDYRSSKDLCSEIELFNTHDQEEEKDFLKWGQLTNLTFL